MNANRYIELYISNATGANLAPIDFKHMKDFENELGLDMSDYPTQEEMQRRLALLLKQHQD